MTGSAGFLILCSMMGVVLVWLLPRRYGLTVLAALTLVSISILSPWSGLWLLSTTVITGIIVNQVHSTDFRGVIAFGYSIALVFILFMSRELEMIFWIGGAYFTLRHLHVIQEWWKGRLNIPTMADYIRYNLYLPVIMAGPIHRLDNFQRRVNQQAITLSNVFSGAERILIGFVQVVVVSVWVVGRARFEVISRCENWPLFFKNWINGSFDWIFLYFSFAGFTSIALGIALMMGLKLEENFNRPWAAKSLIDFWGRWHMTLSNWCREYVFTPVTAVTRLPVAGLGAAMLAMGLWHESSTYYILWAIWQSLGIFITHISVRLFKNSEWSKFAWFVGPVSVYLWLSLTKPVILSVLNL